MKWVTSCWHQSHVDRLRVRWCPRRSRPPLRWEGIQAPLGQQPLWAPRHHMQGSSGVTPAHPPLNGNRCRGAGVQETTSAEAALKQLVLTSGDCAKLMPDGSPDEVRQPCHERWPGSGVCFGVGTRAAETLQEHTCDLTPHILSIASTLPTT